MFQATLQVSLQLIEIFYVCLSVSAVPIPKKEHTLICYCQALEQREKTAVG